MIWSMIGMKDNGDGKGNQMDNVSKIIYLSFL